MNSSSYCVHRAEAARCVADERRRVSAARGRQESERRPTAQVMAEYPELLQSPIVVRENKFVLGRPVDKLTELDIK